jgi:hypothetical protein
MWHYMLRPKMSSWISDLAFNLFRIWQVCRSVIPCRKIAENLNSTKYVLRWKFETSTSPSSGGSYRMIKIMAASYLQYVFEVAFVNLFSRPKYLPVNWLSPLRILCSSSVSTEMCRDIAPVSLRPLPLSSFLIHYALTVLSFGTICPSIHPPTY